MSRDHPSLNPSFHKTQNSMVQLLNILQKHSYMTFSLKVRITPCGYRINIATSLAKAKTGDEAMVELEMNHNCISVDLYVCAIKTKHEYFIYT